MSFPRNMSGLKFLFLWTISWIFCYNLTQAYDYYAYSPSPVKETLEVWRPRITRLAVPSTYELDCERPEIYYCEEPPNVIPADEDNICNFRNVNYQEQIFRWVAGWGCLFYTPDFLYVNGNNPINMNASCFYDTFEAPCVEIAKEDGTCGCYPFDPGLPEVVNIVEDALIPSAQGRWERCYFAAVDCCDEKNSYQVNLENETACGATFDAWTCWRGAEGDSIATEICSEFAYSNSGPSCHHFSSKQCFANGTWNPQTDYSTCSVTPRLLRRYRFHIAMLSFSIISCFPAVVIFFSYKRLRIIRVALHRNLLIAIIIRNILVIVSRSEIYIDELTSTGDTVMSMNGVWCRVLGVAERIAANAVFICMLVEGIYLHRLIVAVFKTKFKVNWLYVIGLVIAVLPVVVWAIIMGLYDNHACWLVYTTGYAQWILDTPRIIILLINTVLFINVMRVLLTKVRNSENSNQLNTAKATLFLMPIFGVQFLLTAFRPNTTNCPGEQAYYYVAYTIEGLQGFIVAMLYCYVNKEVHTLIKATYKKTETFVSRVRDSTYPRPSNSRDRRLTYSTGLPSQNDLKSDYSTVVPKLHVAEITSIQASERLAELLEPVYETIDNGITNHYYAIDKSDEDFGYSMNKEPQDDYYTTINVPNLIHSPKWIRCVSTPTSICYDNATIPEVKNPFQPKVQDIERERKAEFEDTTYSVPKNNASVVESGADGNRGSKIATELGSDIEQATEIIAESEYEDSDNMLDEIMNYIESNDSLNSYVAGTELNPNLFSPNRKEEDKIVFVHDNGDVSK